MDIWEELDHIADMSAEAGALVGHDRFFDGGTYASHHLLYLRGYRATSPKPQRFPSLTDEDRKAIRKIVKRTYEEYFT